MRVYIGLVLVIAAIAVLPRPQSAAEPGATTTGPVVAELFTSQGCSSCPPAEAIFEQLAQRDDLVVIEWHVDYWDDLVYGAAGRWEDPFSSPAHTERQRDYNAVLRSTRSVYTPQAIIGGQREAVGSNQRAIAQLIATDPGTQTEVTVTRKGNTLDINIAELTGFSGQAEVRLVTLEPAETTRVRAGENKGRTLTSRNIALASETVSTYRGSSTTATTPVPADGKSCAVIVQSVSRRGPGQVLGAAYCPV